jgi:RND family efflux transporter MFP subunit
MKKTFTIYLISITLLAGACKEKQKAKEIVASDAPVPVQIAPVQTGGLSQQIEASGLLQTEEDSKLSFKTGGVVESVLVNEGDFVKRGQLLATLRNTEIAAQVGQVDLNVQKSERDYQRIQNLYRDSVATLEQLQNAKTGLDLAKQSLSVALFNQQFIKLIAPTDGFVIKKLSNNGEIAGPGTPVLLLSNISANSQWVLKAGLSDAQWALVKTGSNATVHIDAYPEKTFSGKVSRRSLTADPVTGSFTVEIRVNLQGAAPAVGMYAKAIIQTAQVTYVSVIPYAALLEANGNNGYVFITRDKKTVQRKNVLIGRMQENRVEIISGLESGDMVIITGSAYLNERSTIKVE